MICLKKLGALLVIFFTSTSVSAQPEKTELTLKDIEEQNQVFNLNLTLKEVEAAQQGWCDALVAISQEYQRSGHQAAKELAETVIDTAYGFNFGPVAFKPTYAVGKTTFRTDREGALAYFVGPDPDVPEFGPNQGFATYRNRKSCEVINDVVQLIGTTANTMGFVKVTDVDGTESAVEKTWTFWKPQQDSVRIILHHSSAPFNLN
tara:strand:+ start:58 stop:672 length:615 start_codon:yes stop_codon:yes gene_type:complete